MGDPNGDEGCSMSVAVFLGGLLALKGILSKDVEGLKKERDAANCSEIPVDAKTPLKSEEV